MEQDAYSAGQAEFNLPHDVIQLPSQGIFYKSKKKSIKVGYLTAVDENILSNIDSRKNINEGIILPLLRNKVFEKDLSNLSQVKNGFILEFIIQVYFHL